MELFLQCRLLHCYTCPSWRYPQKSGTHMLTLFVVVQRVAFLRVFLVKVKADWDLFKFIKQPNWQCLNEIPHTSPLTSLIPTHHRHYLNKNTNSHAPFSTHADYASMPLNYGTSSPPSYPTPSSSVPAPLLRGRSVTPLLKSKKTEW